MLREPNICIHKMKISILSKRTHGKLEATLRNKPLIKVNDILF